jgi:Zn-dependent oligopeptidase
LIQKIAQLRAQKAQLLGYPNYAAYSLYDQMAKTPDAAKRFMAQLVPATAAEQRREAAELQKTIVPARALRLGFLFGQGSQGEVRPRPERAEAVFRD